MDEQIEKPWAVYSLGIGKVVEKDREGRIWITSFETNSLELAPKKVETFESPCEAISYFLNNQPYNPPYSLNNLVTIFLDQFPNERKNIESLLSQSQPKCTEEKKDICEGCMRKEKSC